MNLSKTEAIQAMMQGKKVAHDLFSSNEFITCDPQNRVVTDEAGTQFPSSYFWDLRCADYYEKDWRIVE